MTHLLIVRGWPPSTEILMQARSSSVIEGSVYGLPGDTMTAIESTASKDESLSDDVRWRIRRRAALREACKELGHCPNHEYSLAEAVFPEIDLGKHGKLCREVCYTCLPTRLREEFVNDVGRCVCFQSVDAYPSASSRCYFLYHLDGDSIFFNSHWKPRTVPEVRWKVDESIGEFGYLWQPLNRVLSLPLCSWVQSFFLNYDVIDSLRYLGPGSAIHNGERPYPPKVKPLTAKGKASRAKGYSKQARTSGVWWDDDGGWWSGGWAQDW